jgi:hypothetical protein
MLMAAGLTLTLTHPRSTIPSITFKIIENSTATEAKQHNKDPKKINFSKNN